MRLVSLGEGFTQLRDHLKARLIFTPLSGLVPHDTKALDRSERLQVLLGRAYLVLARGEKLSLTLTLAMVAEGQNNDRAFRQLMRRAFADAARLEQQAVLTLAQLRRLVTFRLATLDLGSARRITEQHASHGLLDVTSTLAEIEAVEAECSNWRIAIEKARCSLFDRVRGKHVREAGGDIIVQIPAAAFRSNPRDYFGFRSDIRRVFGMIFETIESQGLNCIVTTRIAKHGRVRPSNLPIISYHTIGEAGAGLHVKETDRPHYFSADPTGYSGWSTLGQPASHVSDETGTPMAFIEVDRQQQLASNASKYKQPARGFEDLPPNYLFIALQVIDDAVQRLAYVHMFDMLEEVSLTARQHGLDVVVKRHPLCKSSAVSHVLTRGCRLGWFQTSEASIHTLIEKAAAVCVVNSGVGAEALLHGKPVYTFGACDYANATHVVRRSGNFARDFTPYRKPIAQDQIATVLHCMRTNYAVDIRDAHASRFWWDRKIRDLTSSSPQ